MEKQKFNLSKKVWIVKKFHSETGRKIYRTYPEENIKEFIRLLKDWLNGFDGEPLCNGAVIEVIDKLAGEKFAE